MAQLGSGRARAREDPPHTPSHPFSLPHSPTSWSLRLGSISARDQVLMAPFSPQVLSEHGYGQITTEIREGQTFYYAEYYHQQYLSKNPDGYCGLGGTGVSCPLGIKK